MWIGECFTSKKSREEEEKLNGEQAAERMEELSFHVSRRRLFVAFFFETQTLLRL